VRYYFDLDGVRNNLSGTEYASDAAARQEAIFRAVDDGENYGLPTSGATTFIVLRDETGRLICSVPIRRSRSAP
jgi:hypothetical protein